MKTRIRSNGEKYAYRQRNCLERKTVPLRRRLPDERRFLSWYDQHVLARDPPLEPLWSCSADSLSDFLVWRHELGAKIRNQERTSGLYRSHRVSPVHNVESMDQCGDDEKVRTRLSLWNDTWPTAISPVFCNCVSVIETQHLVPHGGPWDCPLGCIWSSNYPSCFLASRSITHACAYESLWVIAYLL